MMFTARLLLQVILPGLAGFFLSKFLLIANLAAHAPDLPASKYLAVIATGLLTFALAAALRGVSVHLLRRMRPARAQLTLPPCSCPPYPRRKENDGRVTDDEIYLAWAWQPAA